MGNFKEAVKKHNNGTILALFVTPNAGLTIFPAGYNNWRKRIEIKVASAAKDNKANKEVIKTVEGKIAGYKKPRCSREL